MRFLKQICAVAALCAATVVEAGSGCTLLQPLGQAPKELQLGDSCDLRESPGSTFKFPLALMGYDTGLLKSAQEPEWAYDPSLNAPFKSWRQATTPQRWLRYSVVWYSQRLTRELGMLQFQRYVDDLNYGNRDLSGDAGRDNGLTHAWLSSSLKISPQEQMDFLQQVFAEDTAVSAQAHQKLRQALPSYEVGDLQVIGKTGTVWQLDQNGAPGSLQSGWFVGLVQEGGAAYVFVHLRREAVAETGFAGSRARTEILSQLPSLIDQIAH